MDELERAGVVLRADCDYYKKLYEFNSDYFKEVLVEHDPVFPDIGMLWGIYTEPQGDSVAWHQNISSLVGSTPSLVLTYKTPNSPTWITDQTAPLAGQIPVITLESYDTDPLGKVLAGQYDTKLTNEAKAIAALGRPAILRILHEMNGDWYPWGGAANGSNAAAIQKYRDAYKHIHDVVKTSAPNIKFMWSVNSTTWPNTSWNAPEEYYPGHDYVDYIGADGYNFGLPDKTNTTFTNLFCKWYSLFQYFDKPIIVSETACADNGTSVQGNVTTGMNKPAWIDAMASDLKTKFPKVKAVIWFHLNKERLWQIDSSPQTLAAFKRATSGWRSL